MEAKIAPPIIDLALEAGCHVFAEKPACLRAEDFAPLAQKADSKHLHLMLALANRLNPELVAARKLIAEGAIGKCWDFLLKFRKKSLLKCYFATANSTFFHNTINSGKLFLCGST